jgi:hypothetical protein
VAENAPGIEKTSRDAKMETKEVEKRVNFMISSDLRSPISNEERQMGIWKRNRNRTGLAPTDGKE